MAPQIKRNANLQFSLLLPGNATALMDMWIIGDAFLQEMFATLQTMKTSVPSNSKNIPYLYEQYNVFFFFTTQASKQTNFLARIQNAIAEAFNCRTHLPRYILMILDKDLIEAVSYFDYGETRVLGDTTNWIAKELEHSIESRIEDLLSKKPGAVHNNTRIIWVKMIPRKGIQDISSHERKILAAKPKFNAALNSVSE